MRDILCLSCALENRTKRSQREVLVNDKCIKFVILDILDIQVFGS